MAQMGGDGGSSNEGGLTRLRLEPWGCMAAMLRPERDRGSGVSGG